IPNAVIFEELARIGYEKPSKKLTFYKGFFSPKWKFFIHTVLQCLSAITTSWNEFSSTMASAIYVLDLENKVIEMKSSHKAKITELESMVKKLKEENMSLTNELNSFNTKVDSLNFKKTVVDKEKSSKQERKITDIDVDAEVNLEKFAEEMVEVITTAKIIVDKVSTASGELNATNEEPVIAAPTNITTAQPSEAIKIIVDITTALKAKGIVFHNMEESKIRRASSKSHVKEQGKAKLVEEPEVLKLKKAHIAIDEEVARRVKAEWNADMKDNIDGMMLLN
nr:hypothetical protein [Tanacetum cinerariifolium]